MALDTIPKTLLHIKVEVLSNPSAQQSFFTFIDTAVISAYANYTLQQHASPSNYLQYDHVAFANSDTIPVITDGRPVIFTNLSRISKIAGVSDTLTIQGYNLGNEHGSLHFTAADAGGLMANPSDPTFLKGLDDQYMLVWSDTLIKVIVPSVVYQGYEDDVPNYSGGAGTGPIKIKTAAGDSCVSATSLQIPYSMSA